MPKKSPALFIGRFQPFHLGHIDAIRQILLREDHIIIAIGSAQYHFQPDNPWTTSERFQMIEAGLTDTDVSPDRYTIIPVWNIEDYKNWPNHIDNLLPPYNAVYSGSPLTRRLYLEQGKHEIHNIKMLEGISATMIRKKMITRENWKKFVTKNVAALLERWDSVERLDDIQK